MSNLPNPKEFKNFKADLSQKIKFDVIEASYDLEKMFNAIQKNSIPAGYISKLFDLKILKHNPNVRKILKEFIAYSKLDDSIAIILKNDEEIKAIAIHRTKDRENNLIKWKTYGNKKYIAYKIKDDFIFCVYGMKEILICEIFEISYIAFQSDSIAKGIKHNEQFQNDIKPKLDGKYLILLLDNDSSCRDTINPIKEELQTVVRSIIPIEMQDLWTNHIIMNGGRDKTLPKGYDFVEFVNDVKSISMIENNLKDLIKWSIRDEL